ncbi:DNA-binding protein [Burkholderia aenigmatica]|uniref:DNA-binding protein n=1 Tax=Burkholderia aenigmatica TaxID=2015348 RepID=A0ABY6XTD4_9BURK|nr:DNA-binding protein [Burkholderia aenigmatica]VWC78614.1 DNA-binding protein [Burkholderia aenigmatica]VWD12643.1 DNA-binding protein [Burkholderia aenigmatica]
MSTIEFVRKPSIERAFREALTDPRARGPIAEALGWDESQVSRFLSGQLGIPIGKIDAGIAALELRCVSREYLDAHATMSKVGVNCRCAREGFGECGGRF